MSKRDSVEGAPAKVSTESISFRVEQDVLEQLRDLAAERKISLNALVSQILDHYVKLGVYDKTFGFFSISQDVLRLSLAKQSDEEIDKIVAVAGAKIHKQIIMYLYGKVNKQTIVDYLDIFGNRFETFRHFKEGPRQTLTVYHGINRQFSRLYYDITRSILELGKIETIESEKDINDDGFSISFST
jgi:predicted DNA-binding ribbon-helix-helix protein